MDDVYTKEKLNKAVKKANAVCVMAALASMEINPTSLPPKKARNKKKTLTSNGIIEVEVGKEHARNASLIETERVQLPY